MWPGERGAGEVAAGRTLSVHIEGFLRYDLLFSAVRWSGCNVFDDFEEPENLAESAVDDL